MKHAKLSSALVSIFLLLVLIALAVGHTRLTKNPPVIEKLSPAAALPEETLTITGRNFGDERGIGDVDVAGIRITSTHYQKWSDEEIQIEVPDGVKSGRVYVTTSQGKSNGALFTNKTHIPVVLSGAERPGFPTIEEISPEKGALGEEVTISGSNFGQRRAEGKVYFRFLQEASGAGKDKGGVQEYTACSELDYDYLHWSDEEIVVYIPDGAVSGNVTVETDRGKSNEFFFEVEKPDGAKRLEDKRGYQIQHEVEITHTSSIDEGESLEFWVPRLTFGYTQQDIEESHSPDPMWKDYKGVMRYNIDSGKEGEETLLTHTYWFDRYSISTDIEAESVSDSYDRSRKLFEHYTEADPFIPADSELLREMGRRITGGEASPYKKAEAIYRYLVDNMEEDSSFSGTLEEALETGVGGASDFGLLFVTLARTADVPARPVAGYLVYGDKQAQKHVWAEFYLPDYGWIPADPALGIGLDNIAAPVDSPVDYYFGNLDNQHITFSRQVVTIPQVNPNSQTVTHDDPFALQTVWEEYSGSNKGYRSRWGELRVIDWW
ncbi:MAG: transglutaminase domain-containing protein [Spirochaetaceae bacterium]